MADRKVSVEIALRAATREYQRAMADAAKSARTFSSSLKGIANPAAAVASGVSNLTKNIAALAGVAIGLDGLKSALQGIISTGAQFESLQGQVTGLMGSLTAGEAAVAWIQEFAATTPYDLAGVTDAFTRLKVFGLDPMDGTMQALVDTTAAMKGDQQTLEGIILAVGQAWSKQSLQGEEALQLIERGVPVWDLLAEAMGKSSVEIQKLSSEGQLGRDAIAALIDEMGRVNAGAAISAMDSFNGRLSNLRDAWEQAKNAIAEGGALEAASEILADLATRVRDLIASGDLQAWGRNIGDAMRSFYDAMRSVVSTINEWSGAIRLLAAAWAAAKVIQWSTQIAAFTREAVKATAITSALSGGIKGIGKAAATIAGAIAIDKLVDSFYSASTAVTETGNNVTSLASQLVQAQNDMAQFGAAGKVAGEEVRQLWLQFKDGGITAQEALQAAQQSLLDLQTQANQAKQAESELAAARGRLIDLQKTRVDELAKAEVKAAKDALSAKVDAADKALAAKEKELDAGLKAEQDAVDEAKRLRQGLVDTAQSNEDAIREIRRSAMSDSRAQADLEKQVAEKISAAQAAMLSGQYERSQALAKEAQTLAKQVGNARTAEKLYRQAASTAEYSGKRQAEAAEEAAAAQKEANKETEDELYSVTQEAARLHAALEDLTSGAKVIQIEADISAAEAEIARLQARVDALNSSLAAGGNAGGGAVGRFAFGGPIPAFAAGGHPRRLRPGIVHGPGTATSDSILARVSNGEHAFVTRASRARKLWPLLNTLNFGSEAMVNRVLANLPAGLTAQHKPMQAAGAYATGGPVGANMQSVNIHLPGADKPAAKLFGERDQVQSFNDALARWSRGMTS